MSGGQPVRQPWICYVLTESQGQVRKLREAAGGVSGGVMSASTGQDPADYCCDEVASGTKEVVHELLELNGGQL